MNSMSTIKSISPVVSITSIAYICGLLLSSFSTDHSPISVNQWYRNPRPPNAGAIYSAPTKDDRYGTQIARIGPDFADRENGET